MAYSAKKDPLELDIQRAHASDSLTWISSCDLIWIHGHRSCIVDG